MGEINTSITKIAELCYYFDNKNKLVGSSVPFKDVPYHRKLHYRARALDWTRVYESIRKKHNEILLLRLTEEWFYKIHSGEKTEEYRELKNYWAKRLISKRYNAIKFVNGFGSDRPWMIIEYKQLGIGMGKKEWGAPDNEQVFVLTLGKIIDEGNIK